MSPTEPAILALAVLLVGLVVLLVGVLGYCAGLARGYRHGLEEADRAAGQAATERLKRERHRAAVQAWAREARRERGERRS